MVFKQVCLFLLINKRQNDFTYKSISSTTCSSGGVFHWNVQHLQRLNGANRPGGLDRWAEGEGDRGQAQRVACFVHCRWRLRGNAEHRGRAPSVQAFLWIVPLSGSSTLFSSDLNLIFSLLPQPHVSCSTSLIFVAKNCINVFSLISSVPRCAMFFFCIYYIFSCGFCNLCKMCLQCPDIGYNFDPSIYKWTWAYEQLFKVLHWRPKPRLVRHLV